MLHAWASTVNREIIFEVFPSYVQYLKFKSSTLGLQRDGRHNVA